MDVARVGVKASVVFIGDKVCIVGGAFGAFTEALSSVSTLTSPLTVLVSIGDEVAMTGGWEGVEGSPVEAMCSCILSRESVVVKRKVHARSKSTTGEEEIG